MKVALSDRALQEMQRIDVSWRKRASSPDVFLDELEELVERIETTGVIGPVYEAKAKRRSWVRHRIAVLASAGRRTRMDDRRRREGVRRAQ